MLCTWQKLDNTCGWMEAEQAHSENGNKGRKKREGSIVLKLNITKNNVLISWEFSIAMGMRK